MFVKCRAVSETLADSVGIARSVTKSTDLCCPGTISPGSPGMVTADIMIHTASQYGDHHDERSNQQCIRSLD